MTSQYPSFRKNHHKWRTLIAFATACVVFFALWELVPLSPDAVATTFPSFIGDHDDNSNFNNFESYAANNNPTTATMANTETGFLPKDTTVLPTTTTTQQQQNGNMNGFNPGNNNNGFQDQFPIENGGFGSDAFNDAMEFGDGGMGQEPVNFAQKARELPITHRVRNQDIPVKPVNTNTNTNTNGVEGGGQNGNQQQQPHRQQQQQQEQGATTTAQIMEGNPGGVAGASSTATTTATSTNFKPRQKKFAATPNGKPPSEGGSALFISFHEGTAVDFHYVAKKLGMTKIDWKFPRTQNMPELTKDPYAISSEVATTVWEEFEREACQTYDWIVVGDTIPAAGRAFIEGLLGLDSDFDVGKDRRVGETSARLTCKARVILLVTTRFDYYHFNDLAYRASFQLAASRGLVQVVANNPFEEWYMFIRGVTIPHGVPVIRPHGQGWKEWRSRDHSVAVAMVAANSRAADKDPRFRMPVVVANREREKPLVQFLNEGGIQYELLQNRYGGPFALAQYACLIHSPYQVSTMSFYENLAAGVVMFVPDVPLLKVLESYKEFYIPEEWTADNIPWHLVEWYTPYFDPVVIKFSSAEHLQQLIMTTDFEVQRGRVLEFMAGHEKRVLEQWRRVLYGPTTVSDAVMATMWGHGTAGATGSASTSTRKPKD